MKQSLYLIGISAAILAGVGVFAAWIYTDALADVTGERYVFKLPTDVDAPLDERVISLLDAESAQGLHQLAEGYPERADIWAHAIRIYSWELRYGPNQEPEAARVSDNAARQIIAAADRGTEADPDNLYFPFMKAVAHSVLGQTDDAVAAVTIAAELNTYDDYLTDEFEMRIEVIERHYGYRGEYVRIMIISGVLLPHLSPMRSFAQNVAGIGDAPEAIVARAPLARSCYTIFEHSDTVITALVATTGFLEAVGADIPKRDLTAEAHAQAVQTAVEEFQLRARAAGAPPFDFVAASRRIMSFRQNREPYRIEETGPPDPARPFFYSLLLLPVALLCISAAYLVRRRAAYAGLPSFAAAGASAWMTQAEHPVSTAATAFLIFYLAAAVFAFFGSSERTAARIAVAAGILNVIVVSAIGYVYENFYIINLPALVFFSLLLIAYLRRDSQSTGGYIVPGVLLATSLAAISTATFPWTANFDVYELQQYAQPRSALHPVLVVGGISLVLTILGALWWNSSLKVSAGRFLRGAPVALLALSLAFLVASGVQVRQNEAWRTSLEVLMREAELDRAAIED